MIAFTVVQQLAFGGLFGTVIAVATVWVLRKVGHRLPEGMNLLLIIAVSLLSYAVTSLFGGNGYLATYLCGIILGNAKIPKRAQIVTLYDSVDWLAQIMIFFLLGLMATPERLPMMIIPGVALTAFLLFVGRPLATFAIFPLFKPGGVRNGWRKCLFVSWAGVRGAASIVFVFLALASGVTLQSDLFSLILIVALLSIAVQGTFFAPVAKRLAMIDEASDYQLAFNDFQEQSSYSFFRIDIKEDGPWANARIRDIPLGESILIVFIKRGASTLPPRGDTVLMPGDMLVLSGEQYNGDSHTQITQMEMDDGNPWAGKLIRDLTLPDNCLIVSIVRSDGTAVIPRGQVRVLAGDMVTLFEWD
jgi:cell volume regulation protein A